MKKTLLCLYLFLFALPAVAADDLPASIKSIGEKYEKSSPELYRRHTEARKLINKGGRENFRRAYEIEAAIIKEDENFALAYRQIARYFIRESYTKSKGYDQQVLEKAEKALLKAISIEPDYFSVYVTLGSVYTKMQRYQKAKEIFDKAETVGDPDYGWLLVQKARFYEQVGDYERAIALFQKVLDKGSGSYGYSAALSGITSIYVDAKEYDKADKAYQAQLADDPNYAWGWGNYAHFLLYRYNDVDKAIETAEKALTLMNYGMARFTLACALYTKWAMQVDGPPMRIPAQQYFDAAYRLYPNIDKVINKTRHYDYTKITARKLRALKKQQKL